MFRFIGGAYERNTGKFTIFPPGPPYLLHEKDFEGAQLVRRTLGRFKSKLKGSIGEGSNHSNFSHRSSVKILGIQRKPRKATSSK